MAGFLLALSPGYRLKMVVDFTAIWCGPCRMILPVFKQMACRFTGVEFVKIDVDELPVRYIRLFIHSDCPFGYVHLCIPGSESSFSFVCPNK